MKGAWIASTILFASVTFSAGWATADVPRSINYQGRLTNTDGSPVNDSEYGMTITIYDALTGGNALFSEVHRPTTKMGYFNIAIGTINPTINSLDLSFNQPYFIGIALEGKPEMTPRQPLNSVPYALNVPNGVITQNKAPFAPRVFQNGNQITNGKIACGLATTDSGGTCTVSLTQYGFIDDPTIICVPIRYGGEGTIIVVTSTGTNSFSVKSGWPATVPMQGFSTPFYWMAIGY